MIYVFLANGFEEVEAITPIDYIRRCEITLQTVGVKSQVIKSSRDVSILTDIDDEQIVLDENLKMIILPGGMPGTLNLEKNTNVQRAIDYCVEHDIYIGAICAAPSILGHKGLLKGKKFTCWDGFQADIQDAEFTGEPVEVDGKIITARGAGVSEDFAFKLIELLTNKETVERLYGNLKCNK